MKIFIDIGHPAHVHYFKNFIHIMIGRNHDFFITARDKEMAQYLLKNENIKYINRGKGKKSAIGKILYMCYADMFLLKHAIKFKPDLFLGFGSFYTAQVSFLLRKWSIVLDDTENGKFQQLCYRPFANSILSPSTFSKNFGKKHIKFESFLELAYLHPNYFTPDLDVLPELNIKEDEKYVICRFVSWEANHDYGHSGISIENKIKAVKEFSKYAKVFITSEKPLPDELEQFRLNLSPEKIHHAISFSSLLYGESATMASEAAVLGVPSIFVDNDGRGYTDEQESKYKLVYNYNESPVDQNKSIEKAIDILKSDNSKVLYQERAKKLRDDKIDFTSFLVWYIEQYPESNKILYKNIKYQYNFK